MGVSKFPSNRPRIFKGVGEEGEQKTLGIENLTSVSVQASRSLFFQRCCPSKQTVSTGRILREDKDHSLGGVSLNVVSTLHCFSFT